MVTDRVLREALTVDLPCSFQHPEKGPLSLSITSSQKILQIRFMIVMIGRYISMLNIDAHVENKHSVSDKVK